MKTCTRGILLAAALAAAGCQQDMPAAAVEAGGSALEHARAHLDPKYTCPMHPQVIEDEPGSCPICGMDLVPVKQAQARTGAGSKERKVLYWVAPMDPSYRSDKPGKSPMGMDLVPVYADEAAPPAGTGIAISPAVVNNLGVRTAAAERRDLPRLIHTVGYVDFDESRLSHIHPRTEGWIERLYVRAEGERLRKGDKLFELYSPTLVNAQEEYLQALRGGNRPLVRASRERLVALGVSADQIERLGDSRTVQQHVTVHAPQDGIVVDLQVRDGMYVRPATQIMSLADLSSVWVLAEVFESQTEWVEAGRPAHVRLSFLPGREWDGEVAYIYPQLNAATRTLKVRLHFDNPQEILKPNMYADVTIHGRPRNGAVAVPREALIRTGDGARVILAEGNGRFAARPVVAGMESGEWVEIREGIEPGAQVVTSGQFLIDSEASLQASLMRMTEASAEQPPAAAAGQPERAGIRGWGTVRGVMREERKLTLQHDPIPALGWPAMTMDFAVAEGVSLDDLKAGQAVEFELQPGDGGGLVVAAIRPSAR